MKAISLGLTGLFLLGGLWSCSENINEPVVENQFFTIDENLAAGTLFGVVDAYDLDNGQILSFKILEGNEAGTFEIDEAGGHLSVADPTLLDYELNEKISFTVGVSDNGDPVLTSTARITVSLRDLNEFAPVVEDQAFEIAAGAAKGTVIGVVLATDEDIHQWLYYSILSGNESYMVKIDDRTGELTVNDPSAFALPLDQPIELTIMVRDLSIDSKTDTALITIAVKP